MDHDSPEIRALIDTALRNAGMAPLDGHTPTRIGTEHGRAGIVLRLSGGPQPLVAKVSPGAAATCETSFYDQVAPGLRPHTPECYGTHVDGRLGVALIEDLSGARQGGDGPARTEDAHQLVAFLATLHTSGHPAPWAHSWPIQREITVEGFEQQRPHFLGAQRQRLTPAVADWIERLDIAPFIAQLQGGPLVLAHNDFHLGNTMYRGDTELVVFDFQACCRGPAAVDVVRMLTECSLDGSMWPGLLERYAAAAGTPPGLAAALVVLIATIVHVPFFGDTITRTPKQDRMVATTLSNLQPWIARLPQLPS